MAYHLYCKDCDEKEEINCPQALSIVTAFGFWIRKFMEKHEDHKVILKKEWYDILT